MNATVRSSDSPKKDALETAAGKVFLCACLALQFGLQPVCNKKFLNPEASRSSVLIAINLSKILLASFMLVRESAEVRNKITTSWTLLNSVKAAAIPSSLYAVQNLLMLCGSGWLDSMTVNLLNQTKTLSAAFFLYMIMDQRQSQIQLIALFLLFLAAVLLTCEGFFNPLDYLDIQRFSIDGLMNLTSGSSLYVLGLLSVAGASFISGLSTALTQREFSIGRHSIQYSLELAVCESVVLIVSDVVKGTGRQLLDGNLFKHWSWWMMIPVILNAVGGIVVGLVTKYAGAVTKGFALIVGIIVTGVVEALFLEDGTPIGLKHFVAAALVSLSIYLHSNFKYIEPAKEKIA
jgi:UDP-sugar transporter A1/2/3